MGNGEGADSMTDTDKHDVSSAVDGLVEALEDAIASGFMGLGLQHQQAIENCFISPNEADSNWEAANVVDGLFAIARAIRAVSTSIDAAFATNPDPPYTPE